MKSEEVCLGLFLLLNFPRKGILQIPGLPLNALGDDRGGSLQGLVPIRTTYYIRVL